MSSSWSVLVVPLSLLVVVGILCAAAWLEHHMLSAPALIAAAARSPHLGPDTVELVIAKQSAPLLPGRPQTVV